MPRASGREFNNRLRPYKGMQQMKHKQRGVTLTSFLGILVVAGFVLFIGMKLLPMYQEFYAVKSAMKGVAEEPGSGSMDPARVQDLFFRRLDMSYSDSVKPRDVKFERIAGGWKMKVSYEVRKPMMGNIDVVGHFQAEQELTRSGGN